ncbi:PD-(D/E)XK nuclease family protein [Acrocarpospora catenulata]|uniref:PD-(D/E)XK nuclease family protein n=1 Tax=Acrocarpospora catenulata TaxID=2836182 RepID=UPI001BD9ADAE|nr:PD-(D/E)XK nuclease family protein [Acrocarpospora catenulata]
MQDFFFKPVESMLNAIEHGGRTMQAALANSWHTRNCHPTHRAWALEAVPVYLAARARHQAAGYPPTVPVETEWVSINRLRQPDARGVEQYEQTAWGRRYATKDGLVREIWIPSIGSAKKDRSEAEIAAAAAIAATGVPARAAFGEPYRKVEADAVKPQRVRVIGVGLGDGEPRVLADWDAEEAVRRFEEHAKKRYAAVLDGRGLRPGTDCTACEGLLGCTALPSIPGLLGVPAPHRPRKRRSVSISDLRVYASCPARFHLTRTLWIKDGRAESEAIRRGRAVDAWLNDRHSSHPRIPCGNVPLPTELPGLTGDELGPAVRMVKKHHTICPLDGLPETELLRSQWRLAAYDPVVDVVVIADPDLLYTDADGWVWRETKTASRRTWEGRSLLREFPQLALAVLLMAAGVPAGDPRRSRIELEILRESGSACEEIDPFDQATWDEARDIVAGLASRWANDETYSPNPGDHCADCEVRRWCAVSGESR